MNPTSVQVTGKDLPISVKQAVEISSFLRGKQLQRGKRLLEEVIAFKRAVAFNRYHRDMGHKPGMGPARYPVKSAKFFLKLLKSLEANAVVKGLDVNSIVLTTIIANRASRPWRGGRIRRRKARRTHVHIVASERAAQNKGVGNKK